MGEEAMAASCAAWVVSPRVSWSARIADGVDILGRCLIVTWQSRNVEMMWRALMKREAVMSCWILLESQPKTTDSLSVNRMTSLPLRVLGMHRKGRMRAITSKVEDLQPKAWSEVSLADMRKVVGHVNLQQNQTSEEVSLMWLMDAAPL